MAQQNLAMSPQNGINADKLRTGLVGIGFLGSRHLKHILEIDGLEIAGVWDTDPGVLEIARNEHGIRTARSLEELIELSEAVIVVTPTSTHCQIGLEVISAGRPLFIEKPICATYEEGNRLVRAASVAGVPLQVGHIERFNAAFRALEPVKVDPRFIEAHRLAPWNPRGVDVAVVHDLMIHDLDLVLALAGSEPVTVHANGVGVITDSVDIATARLEFTGGLVANVTASRISLKRMRKLRLFGEREYIALDLGRGSCEYVGGTLKGMPLPEGAESVVDISHQGRNLVLYRRMLSAPAGDALRLELEDFRDAVVTGRPPRVTGADGLRALALAERIVATIGDN